MTNNTNPFDDIYCLKTCGCRGHNEAELCTVKRDCDSCHVPTEPFVFSANLDDYFVEPPTAIPAILVGLPNNNN